MASPNEYIPFIQIRPTGLLLYFHYIGDRYNKLRNLGANNGGITVTGAYSGQLSPGAVKRLKRAIQLLVAIAEPKTAMNFQTNKEFKFKLNFITLTLPYPQGDITDKDIKKEVLDVWLKAAKRRFKLRSYIWKAEKQKNGNLHFHLSTDTYIPYDQLRDTWNERLNRLGFIDQFEAKHGHRHPNSTDVHAVRNMKNWAGYMIKYFCKQSAPGLEIDGKVWDCSLNLKIKENCLLECSGDAEKLWDAALKSFPDNYKDLTHAHFISLNENQHLKIVTGSMREYYTGWLNKVKNYVPPKPKEKCQSITNSIPQTGKVKSFQQSSNVPTTNAKNAALKTGRQLSLIKSNSSVTANLFTDVNGQ